MNIKNKLISVLAISVISIFISIFIVDYMLSKSRDLNSITALVYKTEDGMKNLMKNTYLFLFYNKKEYVNKFNLKYKITLKDTNSLRDSLKKEGIELNTINKILRNLREYNDNFKRLIEIKEKIGLSFNEGLNKKLKDILKKTNFEAKRLQDQDVFSVMLAMKNFEKSYKITHNKVFKKRFKRSYSALLYYINEKHKDENNLKTLLLEYKRLFFAYVDAIEELGVDEKSGISGKMNTLLDKSSTLLKEMKKDYIPLLESKIDSLQSSAIIIQVVLGGLIVVLLLIIINSITKPIKRLTEVTKDLSVGDGDLTKKLEINSKDEVGEVNRYVNQFIQKIRELIVSIVDISKQNLKVADDIKEISQKTERLVLSQNSKIVQTSKMSLEIKDKLIEMVKEVENERDKIVGSNVILTKTKNEILELANKVQSGARRQNELSLSFEKLSQEANDVKNILDVISDIADQTNLLALNAAIEAARAGEHGRGFAVVADEIRKLAEKTQKSLLDIESTINLILQSISQNAQELSDSAKEIEELSSVSNETEGRINEAVKAMNEVVEINKITVKHIEENTKQTELIMRYIDEINETSKSVSKNIDDVALVSEKIDEIASKLNERLSVFKV